MLVVSRGSAGIMGSRWGMCAPSKSLTLPCGMSSSSLGNLVPVSTSIHLDLYCYKCLIGTLQGEVLSSTPVTGDLFFDEHLFSDNSTNIDEHMRVRVEF